MKPIPEYIANMRHLINLFVERAVVKPRISRVEYARSIVIPSGPYAGDRYRPERQPVCDLILREFDRDHWPIFLFMWSVQSGKSLIFVNLETCYITEVLQEDQIIALPDDAMVRSKWSDIRQIFIEKGSADLLPKDGPGSKAGSTPTEVRFSNGARLRFMTAGASDAARSGFTARHVCVDEIDKQTRSQTTSQETTPVKQYENRMAAYPAERRRFRGTSTIADEKGFLWTSWKKAGSGGQVLKQCPHCGGWVFPERKHLRGWQNATNELEAEKLAYIACPECNGPWTEEQRIVAVKRAVIVHSGQTIDEYGVVSGDLPPTDIGVVRSNGFDDIMGKSIGNIAKKEFVCRKVGNPDELELEIDQFFFVVPKKSKEEESVPLTAEMVVSKQTAPTRRYRVPEDTVRLVVAVDMHSKWLQYVVGAELETIAEDQLGNVVVVDYGELDSGWEVFDNASGKRRISGLETEGKRSWFKMLDRLFDRCFSEGWEMGNNRVFPGRVYIDSRYNKPQSKAVDDKNVIELWLSSLECCRFVAVDGKYRCRFCAQQVDGAEPPPDRVCAVRTTPGKFNDRHKNLFRPVIGLGQSERDKRKYTNVRGPDVVRFGLGWHEVIDRAKHRRYWVLDTDRSKLQVQTRLYQPPETPGTMFLYHSDNTQEHQALARSVISKMQVMVDGKLLWKSDSARPDDHILDALGIMLVGLEIEHAEANLVDDAQMEVIDREIKAAGY